MRIRSCNAGLVELYVMRFVQEYTMIAIKNADLPDGHNVYLFFGASAGMVGLASIEDIKTTSSFTG